MPSLAVRRPPLWFFSFCAVVGSAFKLGRTADAIVWYEKTIALDPKRAIADADADADANANANPHPNANPHAHPVHGWPQWRRGQQFRKHHGH
jgi:hypothetical protein